MKYFDQSPLRNLGDIPDFGAEMFGDKPALYYNSEVLTWTDMQELANAIANRLGDLSMDARSGVGIYMENNLLYHALFFGIIKAGYIPIPMNFRLDGGSLEHIVDDAGIEYVFGTHPFADDLADLADRTTVSGLIIRGPADIDNAVDFDEWVSDADSAYVQSAADYDDVAFFLYTSGTTSKPKGVPLTHENGLRALESYSRNGSIDPERVTQLTIGPCFHIFGLIGSINTLYDGGEVVMRNRPDPEILLNAITEHGVTDFGAVPSIFVGMINELETNPDRYDISSIRSLGTGAAPLAEDTRERIESAFGVVMTEGWAMTETLVGTALSAKGPEKGSGCVGQPLADVEIKLVDPDTRETRVPATHLDPAAPSSQTGHEPDFDAEATYTGEIAIRGPQVFEGYHNRPEKNAEVFDDEGWFYTRDIARVDEHRYLWIVDRADDMMIVGGENVYPAEVEDALFMNPDIQQAGVVAAPHETKGEAPVAFVVLEAGAEASEEEIRRDALDRVPTYAHPRRVFFVDDLPVTGSQKVQRHKLKERVDDLLEGPLSPSERL